VLLNQPVADALIKRGQEIKFNSEVTFLDVKFSYPLGVKVLNGISFKIKKGRKIGFVGHTGGGKSTLLDVLMGLLPPTSGALCVDGIEITPENSRGWQANLSHVPQSIFLADITIAENIAFGIPVEEICYERVIAAASAAQISKVIDDLPDKYHTVVGERGVRLSGGQRQRIGIARALYKNAQLIVLDEATSSLDAETEQKVMEGIESFSCGATMVIVAHRTSTLKNCDVIYEFVNGTIRISSASESR
jgi:ATP-binding cassette subfamily B protein